MTHSQLAKALGLTRGRVSQMAKAGMPTTSLAEAQAWRGGSLDQERLHKAPTPLLSEETADAATPPKETRHVLDGVDDQGELAVDISEADNPYAVLRSAKLAEKKARGRLDMMHTQGDQDLIDKAHRTLILTQRHRMSLQKSVADWQHAQGTTLYTDEAVTMFGGALQTILQQVDLMPGKVSSLCTDPERARDVIEEYCQKLRQATMERIQEFKTKI